MENILAGGEMDDEHLTSVGTFDGTAVVSFDDPGPVCRMLVDGQETPSQFAGGSTTGRCEECDRFHALRLPLRATEVDAC